MKTKKPTKKVAKKALPAARPTINAKAVDELFEKTIAQVYALQMVWEEMKEKLK